MKDKMIKAIKKLGTADRIKLILAVIMTFAALAVVPVFAWFAYRKQIATMAKIDSPAKLSLLSGAAEDILRFKMSDIDVSQGSEKFFVFCVEGADISGYNLQIAHTTNINFTYSIYRAKEAGVGVPYTKENGDIIYYQKETDPLPGMFVNGASYSGRTIGNASYDEPSYESGDVRQKFAEPLYWQTSTPINADGGEYDEDTEQRSFRNYYVLRVSWTPGLVINDKETDMVYITAQVSQ